MPGSRTSDVHSVEFRGGQTLSIFSLLALSAPVRYATAPRSILPSVGFDD